MQISSLSNLDKIPSELIYASRSLDLRLHTREPTMHVSLTVPSAVALVFDRRVSSVKIKSVTLESFQYYPLFWNMFSNICPVLPRTLKPESVITKNIYALDLPRELAKPE